MNGWSNKETWLVNLWFGDLFHMLQEDGDAITAEYIESFVDNVIADSGARGNEFVADLLGSSLGNINYWELGEHYNDEP